MSYKAKVTLQYQSNWKHISGSSLGSDILPEETVSYEFPVEDATSTQMFRAFGKFLHLVGFDSLSIAKGAVSVAFNSENDYMQMREVADEYDLILAEDQGKKVIELENKIHAQQKQILELKAKLSRFQQIDNPQYTDEEMDAMCYEEGK